MKDFVEGKLPFPRITMKAITSTIIIAILDIERKFTKIKIKIMITTTMLLKLITREEVAQLPVERRLKL